MANVDFFLAYYGLSIYQTMAQGFLFSRSRNCQHPKATAPKKVLKMAIKADAYLCSFVKNSF